MKQKVKDILREHVHQHEYPVNPEEIFAGALAGIKKDQKDRKRYLFGFLLFFGVSVFFKLQLTTLDTNYLNYNQLSDVSTHQDYTAPTNTKTNFTPEQAEVLPQVNASRDIAVPTLAAKETNSSTNSQIQQQKTNSTKLNTKVDIPQQSSPSNSLEKDLHFESETSLNDFQESKQNILESNTADVSLIASQLQLLQTEKDNVGLESEKENVQDKSLVFIDEEEERIFIEIIGLIDNIDAEAFGIDKRILDLENKMDQQLSAVNSSATSGKFALSMMAYYGKYQKDYIAKEDQYLAYANERKEVETELEILTTKLLLSYAFSEGFKLSTGIKYQQFNEQFIWEGNYVVNEVGEQINVNIDNLTGGTFIQGVDRSVTSYNKFEVVSIPVLAGFFKNYNKIYLGINAGPSVELYSNADGQVLSFVEQNSNLIGLPNGLASVLPEFGLSLEANVEIGVKLGRRTEFLAEVSTQRTFSQEQFLSANFNSLSLGLGLRKSF